MENKVTFVLGTLSSGGAERVVSVLSSYLSKSYNVEIIVLYHNEIFYEIPDNVKIIDVEENIHSANLIRKALYFRKYVIKSFLGNKGVVIAFMMPFFIFSAISLLGVKVPIIASERNTPEKESILRKWLVTILSRRFSLLVAQTVSAAHFYNKRNIPTKVIFNPLNRIFINQVHQDPDNLRIVSVGRLIEAKNYRLLIDAFSIVNKEIEASELYIYGKGPLANELDGYIKQKGLRNKVLLAGRTNDIPSVLKHASVYVCSSDQEGMSNALIEAMACGVPVISTKVYGSIDVIKDMINGLLVEIGDCQGLADSIICLLGDKSLRVNLGQNATKIIDYVHPDVIYKKWEMEICRIINNYYQD